jgi:hypothetical protein
MVYYIFWRYERYLILSKLVVWISYLFCQITLPPKPPSACGLAATRSSTAEVVDTTSASCGEEFECKGIENFSTVKALFYLLTDSFIISYKLFLKTKRRFHLRKAIYLVEKTKLFSIIAR